MLVPHKETERPEAVAAGAVKLNSLVSCAPVLRLISSYSVDWEMSSSFAVRVFGYFCFRRTSISEIYFFSAGKSVLSFAFMLLIF